jgi:hypothetical protein
MEQKPTKADKHDWTLTPQQHLTVDLLATGANITTAAETAGVSRQTVSEWKNQHLGFQAALNAKRQELWEAMTDRLRNLLPKALDVVAAELDGEQRLQVALHVLKAAGLYKVPTPDAPTEIPDLEIAREERKTARFARYFCATWQGNGKDEDLQQAPGRRTRPRRTL